MLLRDFNFSLCGDMTVFWSRVLRSHLRGFIRADVTRWRRENRIQRDAFNAQKIVMREHNASVRRSLNPRMYCATLQTSSWVTPTHGDRHDPWVRSERSADEELGAADSGRFRNINLFKWNHRWLSITSYILFISEKPKFYPSAFAIIFASKIIALSTRNVTLKDFMFYFLIILHFIYIEKFQASSIKLERQR